jgi:hypothetical protein
VIVFLDHLNVLYVNVRVEVVLVVVVLAIYKVILGVCSLLCGITDHKGVSFLSFFSCEVAVPCWQVLCALGSRTSDLLYIALSRDILPKELCLFLSLYICSSSKC